MRRRKKKHVDYEKLYNILRREPLNYAKIRELTGVSNASIGQIIDGLTFRYPLYQIRKGVYGLLKENGYDKKAGEENQSGGEETR
jgi:hypothetical protein